MASFQVVVGEYARDDHFNSAFAMEDEYLDPWDRQLWHAQVDQRRRTDAAPQPGEYALQKLPDEEFEMSPEDKENNQGLVTYHNRSCDSCDQRLTKTLKPSKVKITCPTCVSLPQIDGIPHAQYPGRRSVEVPPKSAKFGTWHMDLEPDRKGGVFTTLFKGETEGDNSCNLAYLYAKSKPTEANIATNFPCQKSNWWALGSGVGAEKVFPVMLHRCPYPNGKIGEFMYARVHRTLCMTP